MSKTRKSRPKKNPSAKEIPSLSPLTKADKATITSLMDIQEATSIQRDLEDFASRVAKPHQKLLEAIQKTAKEKTTKEKTEFASEIERQVIIGSRPTEAFTPECIAGEWVMGPPYYSAAFPPNPPSEVWNDAEHSDPELVLVTDTALANASEGKLSVGAAIGKYSGLTYPVLVNYPGLYPWMLGDYNMATATIFHDVTFPMMSFPEYTSVKVTTDISIGDTNSGPCLIRGAGIAVLGSIYLNLIKRSGKAVLEEFSSVFLQLTGNPIAGYNGYMKDNLSVSGSILFPPGPPILTVAVRARVMALKIILPEDGFGAVCLTDLNAIPPMKIINYEVLSGGPIKIDRIRVSFSGQEWKHAETAAEEAQAYWNR